MRTDIRDTFKIGGAVEFKYRSMPKSGVLKARTAEGLAFGVIVEHEGREIDIDARSITKVESIEGWFITKIPFELRKP